MKYTHTIVILSSLLALTTACSKDDSSKKPNQLTAAAAEGGQKPQPQDDHNPSLLLVSEEKSEDKTLKLTFSLGGQQSVTYAGLLKVDSESPLTTEAPDNASTVTALVFGPGAEVVVAVRETPSDANGLVSTAYSFVKNSETEEYAFFDRQDQTTVSQVNGVYKDIVKDEAKFQAWYKEALAKAKAKSKTKEPAPEKPVAPVVPETAK